jgi:transposase
VRSERLLMEQMQYNLLFRWFVGLNMLEGTIAQEFFQAVLAQARSKQLLSDEHFSVDGTLLESVGER